MPRHDVPLALHPGQEIPKLGMGRLEITAGVLEVVEWPEAPEEEHPGETGLRWRNM